MKRIDKKKKEKNCERYARILYRQSGQAEQFGVTLEHVSDCAHIEINVRANKTLCFQLTNGWTGRIRQVLFYTFLWLYIRYESSDMIVKSNEKSHSEGLSVSRNTHNRNANMRIYCILFCCCIFILLFRIFLWIAYIAMSGEHTATLQDMNSRRATLVHTHTHTEHTRTRNGSFVMHPLL